MINKPKNMPHPRGEAFSITFYDYTSPLLDKFVKLPKPNNPYSFSSSKPSETQTSPKPFSYFDLMKKKQDVIEEESEEEKRKETPPIKTDITYVTKPSLEFTSQSERKK